jgi:hypothetical protein
VQADRALKRSIGCERGQGFLTCGAKETEFLTSNLGVIRYYSGMEDNRAIEILMSLIEKYRLQGEEREGVLTAIGILSWSKLAESALKTRKAKREKDI